MPTIRPPKNHRFKNPCYKPLMKQLSFFPMPNQIGKLFVPQKGKRKSKRPLSHKHPIHLVLRSETSDLKKNERIIGKTWQRFGGKFGIKTYRLVICANHIHAIVRLHNERAYILFVRALTGTLARTKRIRWLNRPCTRIATWGRDFKKLCEYLNLNFLEANGFLDHQRERTRRLPHFVNL